MFGSSGPWALGYTILVLIGVFGVYLVIDAFVRLFSSPLSSIPNAHPTSAYCSFWILWHRYKGNEIEVVAAAHLLHGPVVRLAPSEISINSADESLHRFHNVKVEKSPWYSFFSNYRYVS